MKKRNRILIFGLYLIGISVGIGYQLKKNIDSLVSEMQCLLNRGVLWQI